MTLAGWQSQLGGGATWTPDPLEKNSLGSFLKSQVILIRSQDRNTTQDSRQERWVKATDRRARLKQKSILLSFTPAVFLLRDSFKHHCSGQRMLLARTCAKTDCGQCPWEALLLRAGNDSKAGRSELTGQPAGDNRACLWHSSSLHHHAAAFL